MASATHAASLVLPSEAFEPLATLHSIREHVCTALYADPAMFTAALDLLACRAAPRSAVESLRTGVATGTGVPQTLLERVHNGEFGPARLLSCHGLAETGIVSCMTGPEDPIEKGGSVGRVLPHVSAKVVDRGDRGRVLPVGEKGALVVGGYHVMQRYWEDKARTDEVLVRDDGTGEMWMHTGDEAVMDAEGYVSVMERL